ncbi:hypothetical protein HMPREF1979_02225 [Actinomyces johnsonii F0542]|uniref:Uncharacterized protein n=1 Tax=Actinomyces johnsonii F0542 TaxID=1321818 RepID=U1RWG6_9ACTO|nr:hypothetical protein HMPREF1979_02225 [Actinomyces johnsonii F0542]
MTMAVFSETRLSGTKDVAWPACESAGVAGSVGLGAGDAVSVLPPELSAGA